MTHYWETQAQRNLNRAEDQLALFRRADARVRELHSPVAAMGMTICDHCSVQRQTGPKTFERIALIPSPCPTILALNRPAGG